jgi:hypothetical protein
MDALPICQGQDNRFTQIGPKVARTRPSGFLLVPRAEALVTQEVAEIDERGRVRLSPRWTEQIPWLKTVPKSGIRVLMVFAEPGRLSLRSWESYGPQIVELYRELAERADPEDLEPLRLIQDRYAEATIRDDSRIHLGDPALAHLGYSIARGTKAIVYVAVFSDKIDLISREYRNAKLTAGHPLLDHLP